MDRPALPAGHWAPELIRRAGGEPISGADGGRSVAVSWEAIAEQRKPDACCTAVPAPPPGRVAQVA